MKVLILALFSLTLTFVVACDSSSDGAQSAASQPKADPQNSGKKVTKPDVEEVCEDSPLASCEQLLAIYVLSYVTVPKEPTGNLLTWHLRLDPIRKIYRETTVDRANLTNIEDSLVAIDTEINEILEGCEFAETEPSKCAEDPAEFKQVQEKVAELKQHLVVVNHMVVLREYDHWATNINARINSNQKIEIDPADTSRWLDWVNDERYVVDKENFLKYAKKQAQCDSDELPEIVVPIGDQESSFEMNERLKSRLCNDEELSFSQEQMIRVNFPVGEE